MVPQHVTNDHALNKQYHTTLRSDSTLKLFPTGKVAICTDSALVSLGATRNGPLTIGLGLEDPSAMWNCGKSSYTNLTLPTERWNVLRYHHMWVFKVMKRQIL